MSVFKKFLPILVLIGVISVVIWQVEPPKSLSQASFWQIGLFFVPLFLLFTLTINFLFHFYLKSVTISLGLTILLVLKSLDIFNIVTIILTILAIILITRSLKKPVSKKGSASAGELKNLYSNKKPKFSKLQKQ